MTASNHHPSHQGRQFSVFLAFLWMLGAVIAVVLFIGVVHSFLPHIGRDLVSLGMLSALAFLAVTALLLSRYPGGSSLSDAIGARRAHPIVLFLAPFIGVSARAPAESLRRLSAPIAPTSTEAKDAFLEMTSVHSETHALFLMLVMAALVPLGEEVFFRGGVFGALRRSRISGLRAAVVTSVGFALCHPQAIMPIGLVAAVLGLLRASSGSLVPGLLAHASFNAVEVLEMSTQWVPIADDAFVFGSTAALMCLLTLFVLVVWKNPLARRGRELEAQAVFAEEMRY